MQEPGVRRFIGAATGLCYGWRRFTEPPNANDDALADAEHEKLAAALHRNFFTGREDAETAAKRLTSCVRSTEIPLASRDGALVGRARMCFPLSMSF